MRVSVLVVLLLALLCASFCTTALNMLFTYTGNNPSEISIEAIATGKVHLFFVTPLMWSNYPTVPSPFALVHLPTLFMTSVFVIAAVWLLRIKLRKPWLQVGLLCLIFPPLLWALGLLMLNNNVILDQGGGWCAMVLINCLFSLFACIAFTILEIVSTRRARPLMAGM